MIDGLAQRLFLGLLQCRGCVAIETRRIFPVRPEHMREERRWHLVMLGVGGIGVFGDAARHHFAGKTCIAGCVAGRKPRHRARAEPADRGADHQIGQRHPFGGAYD
jgi:hypothetical protein